MNHGLIVGLILVAMSVLVWITHIKTTGLFQYFHWAVLIGAVYHSIKTWRDQYCRGYIRYGQALGFGIRVMFFASVIFGFYTMLFLNWIDPDSVEESLSAVEEAYYSMGFPDDQIEQFMVIAQGMQTPGWQVISTIFGTTFLGLLISLIVSIFVKKEGDPFQSAMERVQDEGARENQ